MEFLKRNDYSQRDGSIYSHFRIALVAGWRSFFPICTHIWSVLILLTYVSRGYLVLKVPWVWQVTPYLCDLQLEEE